MERRRSERLRTCSGLGRRKWHPRTMKNMMSRNPTPIRSTAHHMFRIHSSAVVTTVLRRKLVSRVRAPSLSTGWQLFSKSQKPVKLEQGKPTAMNWPVMLGSALATLGSKVDVHTPLRTQQTWHSWPSVVHSQSGASSATQTVPVHSLKSENRTERERGTQREEKSRWSYQGRRIHP